MNLSAKLPGLLFFGSVKFKVMNFYFSKKILLAIFLIGVSEVETLVAAIAAASLIFSQAYQIFSDVRLKNKEFELKKLKKLNDEKKE